MAVPIWQALVILPELIIYLMDHIKTLTIGSSFYFQDSDH